MIRPAILTYLRKGKMICQKVYPTLIDTWNYLVSRVDNIKGDQDVNASDGWITVDNTKPTNPIIRFDSSKLSAATATSGNADIKVDTEATTDQKSIDWLELSSIPSLSSDGKALQLFGFDDATQTNVDINDSISSFSDLPQGYVEGTSGLDLTCAGLSDNIEFVCRESGEIKYYRPVLHLPPLAVPDTVTTG